MAHLKPQYEVGVPRRSFLGAGLATLAASTMRGDDSSSKRVLLRSSWQTVNIGDIAHTPGMLALMERELGNVEVTLWPSSVGDGVQELLTARFPHLQFAITEEQRRKALEQCDFCLHGSGPGLVGRRELDRWRETGKPYGIGGVTLNDGELRDQHELLTRAEFVFCRDTDSLAAFKQSIDASGIAADEQPLAEFGPDATFVMDLRDDVRAFEYLAENNLAAGEFICAVPRLRWTPYWIEHPERYRDPSIVAERVATNEQFREVDHAKLRTAITAWVRETGKRVLLCPEMTYQIDLLRPLLFEPLPADVKPSVVVRSSYWMPGEAGSIYSKAFAVVSFEMHSPIIAFANGTPAIHLRQPTDTRKGQMWRDVGLGDWIFEIDDTTGDQIADQLLAMHADIDETHNRFQQAKNVVDERTTRMMIVLQAALEA